MAVRSNIPQSRSALDQVHEQVLNRNFVSKYRQNKPDSFRRAQEQYRKTHPITVYKQPESLGIVRGNPKGRIIREAAPIVNYAAQRRRDAFGGVLGAASGIATTVAGTTSGAFLAPVAVGLGLGFGAYKLGEAIGLY